MFKTLKKNSPRTNEVITTLSYHEQKLSPVQPGYGHS